MKPSLRVLRVALVGCGKAAENHVREIRKIRGASLVAVCDVEPLMAEQLALRHAVPKHFADVDAMLEIARPDVLHVATPPQSHVTLAIKALDAGCHVFVEKPLALSHADALTLVRHAVVRNQKLTIGWGYHFDPIARVLRRIVADGVLGEPTHVESFLGYALDGPFGSCVFANRDHWVHQLAGKVVQNVIDHLLNKVAAFVSDRATTHAQAWQAESDRSPVCSMPDELRVMIFDEKVSAFAAFSSHARPVAHFLNVYGTKNTARLDFDLGVITLASSSALPGALGRLSRTFGHGLQYFRQGATNTIGFARSEYHVLAGLGFLIDAFYDSIRQDGPVPVPYDDLLKVAAMSDAVFARLHEQEAVIG